MTTKVGTGTKLVTPSMCRIIFSDISPRADIKDAEKYARHISEDWEAAKKEYVDGLSTIVSGNLKETQFGGLFKTPDVSEWNRHQVHISYPKLILYLTGDRILEVETQTYVLTIRTLKGMSAKSQALVNVLYDDNYDNYNRDKKSGFKTTVELRDLPEDLRLYKTIADASSDFNFERMRMALPTHQSIKRTEDIRIISIGVQDEKLRPYFERLYENNVSMAELLADPRADALFSKYFNALGLGGSMGKWGRKRKSCPDFKLTVYVPTTRNGGRYIDPRCMLYTSQSVGEEAQFLGVGYDDSLDGEFAGTCTAETARWICSIV